MKTIAGMKRALQLELKRLEKRKAEGNQIEAACLDGSIMTVKKILGWLE